MIKQNFIKIKLLNNIILTGNKRTCEKLILTSFKLLQKKEKKNHKTVFKAALISTLPFITIKQQIVNKKKRTYKEYPLITVNKTRINTAIKQMKLNSNKNLEKINFYKKFNKELLLSSQNQSYSVINKEELYKVSFLKKKQANYRWF